MSIEYLLVAFSDKRAVLADGAPVGFTNHMMLLPGDEYLITLEGDGYQPSSQDIVLSGTSLVKPMVITFTPVAIAPAARAAAVVIASSAPAAAASIPSVTAPAANAPSASGAPAAASPDACEPPASDPAPAPAITRSGRPAGAKSPVPRGPGPKKKDA